jgi:outer membrane protein assembly factor BamB
MIISKYNTNGSVQWQKGLDNSTSTSNDIAISTAVDTAGNVYGSGYRAIFKYNTTGSIVWQKNVTSTTTNGYWTGVQVDSSGNIYVNRGTGANQSVSITTYKIDSTPAITWQKSLSASAIYGASYTFNYPDNNVAIDSSGNVYTVYSKLNTSTGNVERGYLTKYDNSGTVQWTREIYSGIYGEISALTVDPAGNPYIAYGSGSSRRFLSKFDSSGTLQWSRDLSGGTTGPYFNALATDSNNNVYAVGRTLSGTNERILVTKYNSSGTIQFQRTIIATLTSGGSARNARVTACSIDIPNGFIVLGGILDTEFFTARLPIDGSKTGSYTLGLYTMVYGASSLTDASLSPTVASVTQTPTTPTLSLVDQTATDAASTLTNNSVTL